MNIETSPRANHSALAKLVTFSLGFSTLIPLANASDWSGNDGNWGSTTSPGWTAGGIPNSVGAIANFGNSHSKSSTTTQDIVAGVTVGTISYNTTSAFSRTISLTNALTLNQDGAGAGTATISNTNSTASASNSLILSAGTLTLADDLLVSNTGASTNTTGSIVLTSTIGGTGNVTFSSVATALSQVGTIRVLTGDNTFAGSVLVQKGTVTYNRALSFGNTANVITLGQSGQGSAAILSTTPGVSPAYNITVASGSGGTLTLGTLSTTTGTSTGYSGKITLNGDVSLYSATTGVGFLNMSGVISGSGGLTTAGTGTVGLRAANTFTGTTTVGTGPLLVSNTLALQNSTLNYTSGTLAFDSAITPKTFTLGGLTGSANIALVDNATTPAAIALSAGNNNTSPATYTGVLSGAGSLTKIGSGALTLSAANTYTGATTVNLGTLALDFSAATAPTTNIISASSALALGGGTLNLTGRASTTNSQTVNGLTLNAGGSAITLTANATANPLLLALGAITRNAGSTINFTLPTGTQSATNGITTTATNTNGILGGYATVGRNDWASVSGGNIVSYSTYKLYDNVAGWNGNVATTDNLSDSNGFDATSTNSITINSLRFNSGSSDSNANINGFNNLTVTSGGILVTDNTASKYQRINGGGLTTTGSELIITQNNTGSGHLEIGSSIFGTGVSLVKAGPGFLDLTGSVATYTGATTINGGTLQLSGADNALPVATALTINNGTLILNGRNQTVGSLSGSALATVDHAGANTTLTVNQTATTTFAGVIKNTTNLLAVAKTGAGALTLTGANTYTGATSVNGGALLVNGSTAAGSAVTVNNSGSLLGGTGTVNGTVGVNAQGAITGGTMGSGNVIAAGNVGTFSTGALTLASTSLFSADINGAGTGLYDQLNVTGTVSLAGNLVVNIPTGLAFTAGQRLTLIANDGADAITGVFSGYAQGATLTANGYNFTVDYAGGTGNDFDLVAVPEPGTVAAGLLALGGLGFSQLRRRVRGFLTARRKAA